MNVGNVVGQILDHKYKIEKELGKGGMGTVYLATHIGTERPVAVKIIAPEFMQRAEFVERFRREARAAGRLRHPNVVNVTDFGFSTTERGEVAYLVMEYLDGCTLGEILEEEKRLPLSWSIDILEQVCSAVQEAHEQGIIHRDLKPDNIWLEPNQRGGHTVKVLDFGIAKLEESHNISLENIAGQLSASAKETQTQQAAGRKTFADDAQAATFADKESKTVISESATVAQIFEPKNVNSEAGTLVQPLIDKLEKGTAILPVDKIKNTPEAANAETKIISEPPETNEPQPYSALTSELTHVGAVLGTPLYMSPEQCRGKRLDTRSDIYSLGVIAYQMLSGAPPFVGSFTDVMTAHKESEPPPLEAKKIPKKVKQVINSALAKYPAERPQTAQIFASQIRAQSEGIGNLFRRALILYSEHLPKFLLLAIILYAPVGVLILLQLFISTLAFSETIDGFTGKILEGTLTALSTFTGVFCGYLVSGTITWLVIQMLATPLRPVSLRPALRAAGRKWKTFAGTGVLSSAITVFGLVFCLVPGIVLLVIWMLVAPVVMMENMRGFSALKRSKNLVTRSLSTTIATIGIVFFVPFLIAAVVAFAVNRTAESFAFDKEKASVTRENTTGGEKSNAADQPADIVIKTEDNKGININFGTDKNVQIGEKGKPKDFGKRLRENVQEALTQILLFPFSIIAGSFSSIVVALLYLKTRLIGGESMRDLLAQFEETDQPQSNWQKRVTERVQQTGKLTSKS